MAGSLSSSTFARDVGGKNTASVCSTRTSASAVATTTKRQSSDAIWCAAFRSRFRRLSFLIWYASEMHGTRNRKREENDPLKTRIESSVEFHPELTPQGQLFSLKFDPC
jgi:hypothetical protein